MKRIIIVCCFISLCCLCVGTSSKAKMLAKNEKAGPRCTWSLDDEGTLTVKGRGKVVDIYDESVHIPLGTKIKKVVVCKGITAIGEGFLVGKKRDIEKIVLPDTVRTLEGSCFSGLEKLKKICIPQKVTVIPYSAFSGCVSLEEIQFPKNLKTIREDAFGGCHSLKKLVIPDSVTDMDKKAIRNCHRLKTVVLPRSLKKAAPKFEDCLALRTVKNRSSLSVRLDTASGRRVWQVAGKKTNKLKGHQTAKTRGAKFQITYDLRGGNVVGKKPTFRYYGDKVNLPRIDREGYEFLGWRCLEVWTYGEEFLCTYDRDAKLIAWFVRVEIEPRPDGTVRVLITDDKIPWQAVSDDGTVPIDYGYVVRFRKEGREEPIYDGYLLSGQEHICKGLLATLTPGWYLCDISYYYVEDDIQEGAMKEWYLPRWIEIGENK